MLYGLYASGLGAIGQSIKLDTIANNLANLNTPGFRRDHISFRERLAQALENPSEYKYYNGLVHNYGGAPFIDKMTWDAQSGPVETTGRQLDFTIDGGGFFQVKDMNTGKFYYTRAGNFITDSEGRLVTADGKYQVVTEDGGEIVLDPGAVDPHVRMDPDGTLYQGAEVRGRLNVRDFVDQGKVRKFGDNVFTTDAANIAEPAAGSFRVVQGAIEGSSVNPVAEMVEMIKTVRAIESNLQMVRVQDGTLDKSINDFGRVPR